MVSFRLTEEEYERFRRVCMSRGLRNVSELVRVAIGQLMSDTSPAPETCPEMANSIPSRLATLEAQIAELASQLYNMETRLGNGPSSISNPRFTQPATGQ